MMELHNSQIFLSKLPTKAVTLTPQRATVVREIHTTIQPGQNKITILDLDPNVDQDSIRVDGTGPATITGMETEIVPRWENFNDVYPEISDDEDDDANTDSDEALDIDDAELQSVRREAADLAATVAKSQDNKSTSLFVLQFLTGYGKSLESANADPAKLNDFLQMYIQQRGVESERAHRSDMEITEGGKRLERLKRKQDQLELDLSKSKKKASSETRQNRQRRVMERQHKRSQRQRDRLEKQRFWTTNMGQVTVYLDSRVSNSLDSSPRDSVAENLGSGSQVIPVKICLSYSIPGPSWTPRYDLKINTPSSSALMVYNAEFQNNCSETWKDTQISLSTSQASFSGLEERIPLLHPWHIRTCTGKEYNKTDHPSWINILRSPAELKPHSPIVNGFSQMQPTPTMARRMATQPAMTEIHARRAQQQAMMQQAHIQQVQAQQAPVQAAFFGTQSQPSPPEGSWASSARRALGWSNESDSEEEDDDTDSRTTSSANLEHQDSVKQDHGLTTTYDLSGPRTLTPSTSSRRHVLSELNLRSLTLTHIIVPKIRTAAFLRARVKNTSPVNIPRGKSGMSVDGTFLGTSTIPSCAPNDFFSISLGVDPNILVTYAKPTVRRSTGGFFNKENAALFRRTCWVKNTKSIAVDIILSDQLPLNDDEKLRTVMVEPNGLEKEGDQVNMVTETDTGKGRVMLARNGEVKWFIKLEPGKDIRVVLEYETRVPDGSEVMPVA